MEFQKLLEEASPTSLRFAYVEEAFRQRPVKSPLQLELCEDIEAWLKKEQGKRSPPLFIQENPLLPTKTLLFDWVDRHHQQFTHKNKDVILFNLGKGGYPSNSLGHMVFKLTTQAKQFLRLRKRVEVHPESLRCNFSSWIQLLSREVQDLALNQKVEEFQRLIIVIEGLHQMLEVGQQVITMWLPKRLPPLVKVIATLDSSRINRKLLASYQATLLSVAEPALGIQLPLRDLRPYASAFSQLQQSLKATAVRLGSSYFLSLGSDLLFPEVHGAANEELVQSILPRYKPQSIGSLGSIAQLIKMVLNAWFSLDRRLRAAAELLVIANKGLTAKQIRGCFGPDCPLQAFFGALKPFLLNHREHYMIKSHKFRQALGPVSSNSKAMFRELMRKLPLSLRKLQEVNCFLVQNRRYKQLRDQNTKLEHFLMLYNPYKKYDLLLIWHSLEQHLGLDIVDQLSKAFLAFRNEFTLCEQDLFRIILQISKFLQEYAAYESRRLTFLHPPIVAKAEDLASLNLLRQIQNLKLFASSQQANLLAVEANKGARSKEVNWKSRFICQIQPFKLVNVGSVRGRQLFRGGYNAQVEQILASEGIFQVKLGAKNFEFPPLQFDINEWEVLGSRRESKLAFYNYRRWVWLMLPWLSTSPKDDFSSAMAAFSPNQTESYTVEEEMQIFLKALSAVVSVKRERQLILQKKNWNNLSQIVIPARFDPPSVPRERQCQAERYIRKAKEVLALPRFISPPKTERSRVFLTDSAPAPLKQGRMSHRLKRSSGITKAMQQCKSEVMLPKLRTHNMALRRDLDLISDQNRSFARALQSERRYPAGEIAAREQRQRTDLQLKIQLRLFVLQKHIQSKASNELNLDRIKRIVKVCEQNQFCHKEWLGLLNQLISNLKKMIKLEEKEVGRAKEARKHVFQQLRHQSETNRMKDLRLKKERRLAVHMPSSLQIPLQHPPSIVRPVFPRKRMELKCAQFIQSLIGKVQSPMGPELDKLSKLGYRAKQFCMGEIRVLKGKLSKNSSYKQQVCSLRAELEGLRLQCQKLRASLNPLSHSTCQEADPGQLVEIHAQSRQIQQRTDCLQREAFHLNSKLVRIRILRES